jgi:hypothetical protein
MGGPTEESDNDVNTSNKIDNFEPIAFDDERRGEKYHKIKFTISFQYIKVLY